MNKKIIAISCNGSPSIGMGHIMRTLVIAEELKKNFSVIYICEKGKEYACGRDEIIKRGYNIFYSDEKISADMLILDTYDVNEDMFSTLRKKYNKLMYIDDLKTLSFYDCDILLNRNFGAETISYSAPPECKILLGTNYSLLRNEFRTAPFPKIRQNIKEILITMGGTDPHNTSIKVLSILKSFPYNFHIAVGSGFSNNNKRELKKLSDKYANITIHLNPQMANLMCQCDIAITACGGTTHELASLGIPQIGISIASNQEYNLKFGEYNGLFVYAGNEKYLSSKIFINLFLSVANNYEYRKKMSDKSKKLINRNGVALIEEEIKNLW